MGEREDRMLLLAHTCRVGQADSVQLPLLLLQLLLQQLLLLLLLLLL
jgi:hypothetical protein